MNSIRVNQFQEMFVDWMADRLHMPRQAAVDNYVNVYSVMPHDGQEFRNLITIYQYQAMLFARDDKEIYELCQYLHLLRWMSSYEVEFDELADKLPTYNEIVDYGAGVPRLSCNLVQALRKRRKDARLYIVDYNTIISDFARYIIDQLEIETHFIFVDNDNPYPQLPKHNVCMATDALEHLKYPLKAVANIDAALKPGGWVVGNLGDQPDELLHVTYDLAPVRAEFDRLGYVTTNATYRRKPDGNQD